MNLVEVDIDIVPSLLPLIIQAIMVYHLVFIVMVIRSLGIGLTPASFAAYNHGGINISHPIFPQEYIPRGVHGENIHQTHPCYSYPNMTTHPHRSMTPHPNHNMPPHLYPSVLPHRFFVYPYFNYTPAYAPYVVSHYPHIPTLGNLHTSYSIPPSTMLPPHSKKN